MRLLNVLGLATVAMVVLAAAGCSGGDSVTGSGVGQVRFVLGATGGSTLAGSSGGDGLATQGGSGSVTGLDDHSGENRPALKAVHVTFASFLARNLDGQLVDVAMELPTTVDLMSVMDTRTTTLPVGALPPGTYDQIVVVITAVELITQNDTSIVITPPGGGWTVVVRVVPFTVVEDAVTTLELKFRADRSLIWAFDHFEFHPEMECRERDD